ncbi:Armadillo repeat-containing protein 8 [Eumeta japonica]|uniref:Armadillo repeat-containing protein 8 n=1 Tax=Eumeta variegata TaxID=151549 RepID=A0A4C1ZUI2_EUMVA|nr:Armadillo repeat-containing protein 8 [Eumeta japonica]
MQQLSIFMDIESSRSYIDELYSSDLQKCGEALVALKNAVIGSNRQKNSVIQQGIVPLFLQLISTPNIDANIRFEAVVTLVLLAVDRLPLNEHTQPKTNAEMSHLASI